MTQDGEAPWFFDERAAAFVKLALTTRDDVRVRPSAGADDAARLLFEILKDGKPTLRFFGAQFVPYMDQPPPIEKADERVLTCLRKAPAGAGLPICVFVVEVRTLESLYRWAIEPVVQEGRALLQERRTGDWHPLDEAEVASLIGQVNAYYDALNGSPPPKPRGRRPKTESR
jgi:hypothetical protein